jgi:hypothetical protein
MAVAEHHAGQRLDLDVVHALALLLREVAHLRLREFYVLEIALGDLRNRPTDFGRGQPKVLWPPIAEFFRQLADRGVLVILDLCQDAFDRFTHVGFSDFDFASVHSALEPMSHDCLLFQNYRFRGTGPPYSLTSILS